MILVDQCHCILLFDLEILLCTSFLKGESIRVTMLTMIVAG